MKVKISTWNGFSHKLHWLTWQIPHNLQKTFLHVLSSIFRDFINSERVKLGSLKNKILLNHAFSVFVIDQLINSLKTQGYCYNFASLNTKIISRYLCNYCRKLLWNFFKAADVSVRVNCRQLKNRKQLDPLLFLDLLHHHEMFKLILGILRILTIST